MEQQNPVPTALDVDSRIYMLRLQGDRLVEVQDASTLPPYPPDNCVRGVVHGFSPRSAGRMRDYLLAARVDYRTMGTLTYPSWSERGANPVAFKRDLRCFLKRLSRYLVEQRRFEGRMLTGWSIFWWLEWTQSGVAHFHWFCTDFVGKRWLSAAWADITCEGDARVVAAATRIEMLRGGRAAAARYAWSYASKTEQKNLPAGIEAAGRWWGVCGRRETVEAVIRARAQDVPLLSDSGPVIGLWKYVTSLEERGLARRVHGPTDAVRVWQIPEWHHRDELYYLLRRCSGPFRLVAEGHYEDDWWTSEEGWVRWINPPQVESSDLP